MKKRRIHFTQDWVRTFCGLYLYDLHGLTLLDTNVPEEVTCLVCKGAMTRRGVEWQKN